ncbi:hypothetical protein Hte_001852 [Hypoxylon texense]
MPLELQDADLTSDFPALARAMFESYEEPWQPFFHAYFPIHGKGEEAREAAIQEAAARLRDWHAHDPTMYWQKIVDTDNGNIATGALWNIYPENPFAESQELPATWFPDDGSRRFAEQLVELHGRPRARVGQRPHVCQQIMEWGMKKADEMGVEFFLDATPMGRPLYERSGFVLIEENVIDPKTDSPDDAWREIEAKVGSSTHYLMWRPAGGYKEGETIKPWEEQ